MLFGLPRRTAILLVAIIVGFAIAACVYTLTLGRVFSRPSGDGIAYERSAVQLLQKGLYGYKSTKPNAQMSPGYPLFLAGIYAVSGHANGGRPRHLLDAIQIAIACITLLGVFLIGRRLFGDWVGLVAALLVAVYPPTIVATNLWLTETITTALIVWYVFVTLLAYDRDDWPLWALSGAVLGVAVLIRPGFLPIAIAPFIVRFFWGKRAKTLQLAVVSAVAFVLVMAPWMVRNELVVHELAPLSTHGGDPILAGVDPYYYELGEKYQFHGPTYAQHMASGSKVSKTDAAMAAIATELRTRPLQTIWWFTAGKIVRMYSGGWLGEKAYVGTWTIVDRELIVVLGWLGCVFAFREKRLRVLAVVLVLGTLALLSVSPEPRYAFTWIALLSVPAAFVMRRLWTAPLAPWQIEPTAEEGGAETHVAEKPA